MSNNEKYTKTMYKKTKEKRNTNNEREEAGYSAKGVQSEEGAVDGGSII